MLTNYGKFLRDIQRKPVLQVWEEQKYFQLYELVSRGIYDWRGAQSIEVFQEKILLTLLEIRVLLDVPLTINDWYWRNNGFQYRGWRPPAYYSNTLSVSQHLLGNAFDFDAKGISADEVRAALVGFKQDGKLAHLTRMEKDVNWVHIDCALSTVVNEDGLFIFSP